MPIITKTRKPKPQVLTNRAQGKQAEKDFATAITKVTERIGSKAVFERIPDTGDVSRLGLTLPPRRSDFDAVVKGSYFVLEVKCCSTVTSAESIPIKGTWKAGQLAAAARFGKAGAFCFSFVKLPKANCWFIVSTTQLAAERAVGINKVGHQRLFKSDTLESELENFFYKYTI